MDNRFSLLQFFKSYPDDKEKRQNIFICLDRDMKKHHKNGERITSFDPRTIRVTWTNQSDVHFNQYESLSASGSHSIEEVLSLKEKDIETYAVLMFCSYLPYYDFEQVSSPSSLLNAEVVAQNFDDNAGFLPEEDVPYLRSVLVDHQTHYYSDYREQQKQASPVAVEEVPNEYGNSRSLTKSTPTGRALTNHDSNETAQIPFFLLVSVTAMLTLIASLAFVYLYQRIG